MASINISEDDFAQVAFAASLAERSGHQRAAEALDKIARKINASLSNASVAPYQRMGGSSERAVIKWTDVESVLPSRRIYDPD